MMIPGLGPMFTLDFKGLGTRSASFVTPDRDVTLPFHCHVPTHEEFGMRGLIIVGKGSPGTAAMVAALNSGSTGVFTKPAQQATAAEAPSANKPAAAKHLFYGVGVLKAVENRTGRVIIDHKEIPGFMSAMTMSYLVEPASLLEGLRPGITVNFTIDSNKREIVAITRTAK
jgi:Cu/Ag efflux protein CusF